MIDKSKEALVMRARNGVAVNCPPSTQCCRVAPLSRASCTLRRPELVRVNKDIWNKVFVALSLCEPLQFEPLESFPVLCGRETSRSQFFPRSLRLSCRTREIPHALFAVSKHESLRRAELEGERVDRTGVQICMDATNDPQKACEPVKQGARWPNDNFTYPANFAQLFNVNCHAAIDLARQSDCFPPNNNVQLLCRYLVSCKGLAPRALTAFLVSDEKAAEANFYWFFSSIDIDFLSLDEVVRLLFSEVALPKDMKSLRAMFAAFANAYVHANSYTSFSASDIARLAIACVSLSIYGEMELTEFSQMLTQVVTASYEYTKFLFDAFKAQPVQLSFCSSDFTIHPELSKTGPVYMKLQKKKVKKFISLMKTNLRVWRDATQKEIEVEIPLFDVHAKVIGGLSGRDEACLVIARNNKMSFVMSPKDAKKGTKHSYEFTSHDAGVLRSWAACINFTSTRLVLQQLAFE